MRMPKEVKEWITNVDETHRKKMIDDGIRFTRISTGLHWNREIDMLAISGLAQKKLRDYPNLLKEFPSKYEYKLL